MKLRPVTAHQLAAISLTEYTPGGGEEELDTIAQFFPPFSSPMLDVDCWRRPSVGVYFPKFEPQ